MKLVRVCGDEERALFFSLLDEFGSRAIVSRKGPAQDRKFDHYAVRDVIEDEHLDCTYYETNFPEHYVGFINYLLDKFRDDLLARTY